MTSVSNMNGHKNPDYLSRLPPELLDAIFELAYDYKSRQTTPLSKRLLSFQERLLFRELEVHSYNHLEKLCMVAQRRSEALAYAKVLRIDIARESETKERTKEVKDAEIPSNNLVKLLFHKLTKITRFHLSGSSRLALLVLDSNIAASSFPRLTFLTLASTFGTFGDPFHPALYIALQHYPNLKTFHLHVWRPMKSIRLCEKSRPEISPFLANVSSLYLRGPLSASEHSVTTLLSSSRLLSDLNLIDTSQESRIFELLDALVTPSSLNSLQLSHDGQGTLREHFSNQARTLVSLKSATFGGSCSSLGHSFYNALHTLPLEVLAFETGAEVSLAELTKMISGKTKHKTLRTLRFDQFAAKKGTRIRDAGQPFYNVMLDDWDIHRDWVLPEWTRDFDEDGLNEFIKLAKDEGVEVGGSVVQAMDVLGDYSEAEEALYLAAFRVDERRAGR